MTDYVVEWALVGFLVIVTILLVTAMVAAFISIWRH
ncbi:hypothetical protein SEA_BACONJACK_60 [Mycobacterium phage BaconJack]|nr:hypothetical protein SEA_BACONJACK_60 [Mycobacterium phage BaconJack]